MRSGFGRPRKQRWASWKRDAVVTRLRLGLESTYAMGLSNGSTLTPKLEIGLRHDDGDAETGLGVDFGAGLAWWTPGRVLFVELEARSLIVHQAEGLRDWSVSGLVRYDPNPVIGPGFVGLSEVVSSARWRWAVSIRCLAAIPWQD